MYGGARADIRSRAGNYPPTQRGFGGALRECRAEGGAVVGCQLLGTYGATIRLDGTAYKISGGATNGALPDCWLYCYRGSVVETSGISLPPTLTNTGTPNYAGAHIQASMLSSTFVIWASITGAATGKRYQSDLGSVILSGGGGVNYYPGNVAGTTANGGIYA